MIRGYFSDDPVMQRPFVRGRLAISGYENASQRSIEFLVDTGSDTTLLSPMDAEILGIDTSALVIESSSGGLGGEVPLKVVEATLTIQGYPVPIDLYLPDDGYDLPSLLGRDFMSGFALFMEERTRTVVLLDRDEVERMALAF